jgi:hypothetical protein
MKAEAKFVVEFHTTNYSAIAAAERNSLLGKPAVAH